MMHLKVFDALNFYAQLREIFLYVIYKLFFSLIIYIFVLNSDTIYEIFATYVEISDSAEITEDKNNWLDLLSIENIKSTAQLK